MIATDEIRSYAMFNFANINWTSSATAGALIGGRGGKQSAIVSAPSRGQNVEIPHHILTLKISTNLPQLKKFIEKNITTLSGRF